MSSKHGSVRFNGLARENEEVGDAARAAISRVIESSWFIGGEEVEQFESSIAVLAGAAHAVAVNSGTDALRLALRALDLPPGSEIITSANTFVATVGAALDEGFRVKLVDVGPDENVDAEAVADAIGPATSAVIAVHLRGLPADMARLRALCDERRVVLIEDAAQAISATTGGRRVGGVGEAGCFSMHPLKNLGAFGDAGAVVTQDAGLADRMRLDRNHGLADRDRVTRWGVNSRLDALQAAVLNVKIERLDDWTRTRREIAEVYSRAFKGLPLSCPSDGPRSTHVYHRYVVRTDDREALSRYLQERGVETAIHYPIPIHHQVAIDDRVFVGPGGLANTERDASTILSLPLYPQMTDAEVDRVQDAVIDFFTDAAGRA